MICKNCGTEFNSNFCPNCGTKPDMEKEQTISPEEVKKAEPAAPAQQKSEEAPAEGAVETAPGVYEFNKGSTNSDQPVNTPNAVPVQNIQQTPQKKPFYKKPFIYILGAIVILLIIIITGCNTCSCGKSSGREYNDTWPTYGLAQKLPKPKSEKLHVSLNSESYFSCDVGDTDKKTFDSYVSECMDKGFTVDYDSSSTTYYAFDKAGYYISLYLYESKKEMSVSIDAPKSEEETKATKATEKPTETKKEETKAPETKAPETKAPETKAPETEKEDSDTVTESFKELMDGYEAFIDEYIRFMKEYENSDDVLGMLNDYNKWLSDYMDWIEKIDEIDTDDLSIADYNYYMEVINRVNQKLTEINM